MNLAFATTESIARWPSCRIKVLASTLAGAALWLLAHAGAWASVISSSPTFPVLGVPYSSAAGVGCFSAIGVCISPGTLTPTALVSSMFIPTGQDIVVNVTYSGLLTDLSNAPMGSVTLAGSMEMIVNGRTFGTETGTWSTDLVAMSLSGSVLGATLDVTLDPQNASTGETSIEPLADGTFRVDSFFDVFVQLDLDFILPLHTERGPIHVELASLASAPEPATAPLIALAVLCFAWMRRRLAAAAADCRSVEPA